MNHNILLWVIIIPLLGIPTYVFVSLWNCQEADAKAELYVKGIYWGKIPRKNKRQGSGGKQDVFKPLCRSEKVLIKLMGNPEKDYHIE